MKINLKDMYPFVKEDQIIEIDEDIYNVFKNYDRQEKNYKEKVRRNRAYYSLDRKDGIENNIAIIMKTPQEIFEDNELNAILVRIIYNLPDKQRKRIYMYYYMNMNMNKIAELEGVHRSRISASIKIAKKNMKNILINYYKSNK